MPLFFHERDEKSKPDYSKLPTSQLHKLECRACPLDRKKCVSPKMEPTGSDDPIVYMLGEAPDDKEDRQGKQFVGSTGRLLRKFIPKSLKGEVRWNNCVRTYPGERKPTDTEVECCRPSVERDIEKSQPFVIIGFGSVPLKWALEEKRIDKWRGRPAPVQIGEHVCWFIPMVHPAQVLRNTKKFKNGDLNTSDETYQQFKKEIKYALNTFIDDAPDPEIEPESKVYDGLDWNDSNDYKEIVSYIDDFYRRNKKLINKNPVGTDVETNGLDPFSDKAELLTISIGTNKETISFPVDWWKDDKFSLEVKKKLSWFFSKCSKGIV